MVVTVVHVHRWVLEIYLHLSDSINWSARSKLKYLLQHFGFPMQVLTDRGSALYRSKEFEELCKLEKIRRQPITTGVSIGKGQVERINSVINNTLRKIAANNN